MRFSTFLLLFLFIFSFGTAASAQNLIYDWSVEEYETCPTGLALTLFVPHWFSFRGSPDYFNTCSSIVSPVSNSLGWQHPNSGDGMIGCITFHGAVSNLREYPGVELMDSLIIGESYEISYYVATAYSENPWVSGRATNNLGVLFMTENYLNNDELGPIPNYAHFNVDTLVADTAEWVHVKGLFVADSAYKFVAFGNFYDDQNTIDSLLPEREFTAVAYYYLDDFCLTLENGSCQEILSLEEDSRNIPITMYPNPADDRLLIKSEVGIKEVQLISFRGDIIELNIPTQGVSSILDIDTSVLSAGLYIILLRTEAGIARKKIVIQH